MKDSNKKLYRTLFIIILILLFIPLLLGKIKFLKPPSLKGAIVEIEKKDFSFEQWMSGDYQLWAEKYLNESFGFRSFFVRVNNQIAHSFFSTINANGVIFGKQNYFYEENYIKAYYGRDYVGEDSIKNRLYRLKYLQDTLSKLNKTLFIVFAAGKGSFYPEYIPDNFKSNKSITNLECFTAYSKDLGVSYIDFNSYFVEQKYKSKYPLYPQYGIHWSSYGAWIAADSIIRYIEKARKIEMGHFECREIKLSQPIESDYDIGDGLNLLFKMRSFKMAYPQMELVTDSNKVKPSMLVIADSYYWLIFSSEFRKVFGDNQFWFYNEEMYGTNISVKTNVNKQTTKDELLKYDIIIIMATEATLPGFGWGFIENSYNQFMQNSPKPNNNDEFNKEMLEVYNYIKSDKEWYNKVVEKSKNKGVTVDSMLKLDALWVIEQRRKK
jgi:hypothetical protein